MSVTKLFDNLGVPDADREDVIDQLHKVDKSFIQRYVWNTKGPSHNFTIKILDVFKIERPGCKVNYKFNLDKRRLLWHGTKPKNVFSILRNGLQLKKAKHDGMFGSGLYFADCVTKAANYSFGYNSKFGYLFLCEVALGDIKTLTKANKDAKDEMNGANSIMGVGRYGLLEETSQFSYETLICPGVLHDFGNKDSLEYNEYIVYSSDQVQLRYLVKVEHVQQQEVVVNV